jgi:hypothetical protein
MPNSSLQRRIAALEAKHAPADYSAQIPAASDTFRAKMGDLIARTTVCGRPDMPATALW